MRTFLEIAVTCFLVALAAQHIGTAMGLVGGLGRFGLLAWLGVWLHQVSDVISGPIVFLTWDHRIPQMVVFAISALFWAAVITGVIVVAQRRRR